LIDVEDKWFKASELEKSGRLREALRLYLEKAEMEKDPAMAAISFLSAARCAIKLGEMDRASELFRAAGRKYEEVAEKVGEESPNLLEWAYSMASRCYQLAGDRESSENVLSKIRKR